MITSASQDKRRIAAMQFLTLEDPEAGEEAILAAMAWAEESPENYELLRQVSRFSHLCVEIPPEEVEQAIEVGGLLATVRTWLHSIANPWAIAASVALLSIGLAYLTIQMSIMSSAGSAEQVEYFTDVGETRVVRLPDQTEVTLGAASAIRVYYQPDTRRVVLTAGEAYFSVTGNRHRPFVVETTDGEITALGTKFNVHRAPEATTVTLLSGRIKAETLQNDDGPVAFLRPNSQVSISAVDGLSPVRSVDGRDAVAWQRGSYRYDDVSLASILTDLRRYYDRPIVLDTPSLGDLRFTGLVKLNQTDIEQWLVGLQYIGNLQTIVRDDIVIILKKPGEPDDNEKMR